LNQIEFSVQSSLPRVAKEFITMEYLTLNAAEENNT